MGRGSGVAGIMPRIATTHSARMRFLAVLFLAGSCSVAAAADTARARLDAFAAGLHSISGSFSQSVADAAGHAGEEARGQLALEAPRQFRWEVTSPYRQTIVADGSRVWVYEPDLEQVSVRSQGSAEAQSPLTVLTDLGQLDREFRAEEAGEREGLAWLRLLPREAEQGFEAAELGLAADGLRTMLFRDQLGNTTTIRFADWQRNPKLATDAFRFTPPPGTDVVGEVPPEAEVFPLGKDGGASHEP